MRVNCLFAALLAVGASIVDGSRVTELKKKILDARADDLESAGAQTGMFSYNNNQALISIKMSREGVKVPQVLPKYIQRQEWFDVYDKNSPMAKEGFTQWQMKPKGIIFKNANNAQITCGPDHAEDNEKFSEAFFNCGQGGDSSARFRQLRRHSKVDPTAPSTANTASTAKGSTPAASTKAGVAGVPGSSPYLESDPTADTSCPSSGVIWNPVSNGFPYAWTLGMSAWDPAYKYYSATDNGLYGCTVLSCGYCQAPEQVQSMWVPYYTVN